LFGRAHPPILILSAALLVFAPARGSATGLWKPKQPSKPVKTKAKPPPEKPKPLAKAPKGAKRATSPDQTTPGAKVAVMAFSGDGAESVRRQVLRVLRAKGLKVNAGLRPVDSAEQYREMASALNLVAYVHGEVSGDGDDESATIHVRGGRTGLRIASATFSGGRRELPRNVGKELWPQMGNAFARACADAAKPRKNERGPMRINAGTRIEDTPLD
jgi:hypothetical protein